VFAVQPAGAIIWPMLGQFALTLLLYVWLTVARKRAVERGETDYTAFVLGYDEPLHVARITRNLANQFELPVLFYTLVLLLVTAGDVTLFDVVAAWVFIAGRVLHTLVQTLTDNVPLRGRVFAINYLAVAAMAGHLAWRLV
jgi:hypothetical protein